MSHALQAQLRAEAQAQMAADSAHDIAHLDRVWANAQAIAASFDGIDHAALCAAAYLHDLVNLPKDAPNRAQASRLSAQAARPVMARLGLAAASVDLACHAIAAHSFSAGIAPQTPEARILQDADRLDALGAIGIARTFLVSGALARPLYDAADPFAQSRPLDESAFAIDHWPAKLLRLGEAMATDAGRRMARARLAVMRQYLHALAAELGQPLPQDWGL